MLIVAPFPIADSIVYFPPSIRTRSAIPISPMPLVDEIAWASNPFPLSLQMICAPPGGSFDQTTRPLLPRCA